MDNFGNYVGGGKRYISPKEIQNMKKNMKKVPIIKDKAEKYHINEINKAEELLEKKINSKELEEQVDKKQIIIKDKNNKICLLKKIINGLKYKLGL